MKRQVPLVHRVRSNAVLVEAWHAIRRNAETSRTRITREQARQFGKQLPQNLRKLADRLRRGYQFSAAYGATPSKGHGKTGKRPIVVAPLEDRIVQRAILDVLQDAKDLPGVQSILNTKTSIGGIRDRGVDDAIKIFQSRVDAGDKFVAGSDISGFFQRIPKSTVVEFIRSETHCEEFTSLFERALTVELSNEALLSEEDRRLFPTGDDGVAQGCPLSAFAGNVVLANFDAEMNAVGRGITCIRYIDDFIIIAKKRSQVVSALASAKSKLMALGMDIYEPEKNPEKAFIGGVKSGHVFLGYKLLPPAYPPSDASVEKLLVRIEAQLKAGRATLKKIKSGKKIFGNDLPYAQTISSVNLIVHGWRASYRASDCPKIFSGIEKRIESRIFDFEKFFEAEFKASKPTIRRKALGINGLDRPPIKKSVPKTETEKKSNSDLDLSEAKMTEGNLQASSQKNQPPPDADSPPWD